MTVLITGGTGFLGQHLARTLVEHGIAVRAMGRDFGAMPPSLRHNVEAYVGDLRDRQAVLDACRGVDAVFHVGAFSAPWGKRRDFWQVNVDGTAHVIEGCRQNGVRRLIYVSSPSVVFDGTDHTNLADDAPYPRRFASVYSETKKIGEDMVNAVRDALETVIIRPKAIFGPGDRALLPRLIAAARAGRLPQIGNGQNRVDLTYVGNVAHALYLALDAPRAVGGTYAITNDEHPLLWDVIRMVLRRSGIPDTLRYIPYRAAHAAAAAMEARAMLTGREPLLTRYTVAILARTQTYTIERAKRDLGYDPLIPLDEGIERTLRSGNGMDA